MIDLRRTASKDRVCSQTIATWLTTDRSRI